MTRVTLRQRQVLAAIAELAAERGYPPTMREIGAAVGLSSSSTVAVHISNLEQIGMLTRDRHTPRSLLLTDLGAAKART